MAWDSVLVVVGDIRAKIDAFQQEIAELPAIADDLRAIARGANQLGASWSGSWIGYHASLYYLDFERPPEGVHFNAIFGGFYHLPPEWREKTYQDVVTEVGKSYHGRPLSELVKPINRLSRMARELKETICTELSFIRRMDGLTEEVKLLGKIESWNWGRQVHQLIEERVPSQSISKDMIAIAQGTKYAPHIQYESEAQAGILAIEAIQGFVRLSQRLIRQIELAHQFRGLLGQVSEMNQGHPTADTRSIFVVHGRNLRARDALFSFLRAIGLKPLEWVQARQATGKPSPYIGEILDAAFGRAQAVVVLMTPDDEARLRADLLKPADGSHESELTPQPRANVLFEAGMAMGRAPDRTVLVELGALRPFTDIAGVHTVRMDGSTQKRQELAERLRDAGCEVDLSGTDWHTAGDFGG